MVTAAVKDDETLDVPLQVPQRVEEEPGEVVSGDCAGLDFALVVSASNSLAETLGPGDGFGCL